MGFKNSETKEDSSSTDSNALRAICPVTLRPMNKKHPFVVLWKTGKVYSAQAIRELPEACGLLPNHKEIVIPLGPGEEQLAKLKQNLKSTNKRKRKKDTLEKMECVKSEQSSYSSSSSSSNGGASNGGGSSDGIVKKKFKSATELFTQGFGFGQ